MKKGEYAEKLKNKDWGALGWYFWRAFLTGTGSKLAKKRWDALTEDQRDLCENAR